MLNNILDCSSKSIKVIKLSFSQNDPLLEESFLKKDSLITSTLLGLQPIMIFSPVANFGNHPLFMRYIVRDSMVFVTRLLEIPLSISHNCSSIVGLAL